MSAPRATVDTRPLFDEMRLYAYDTHDEHDTQDAFLSDLVDYAHAWLLQRGRRGDGTTPADGWALADVRKVEATARSVAAWTWERMHEGLQPWELPQQPATPAPPQRISRKGKTIREVAERTGMSPRMVAYYTSEPREVYLARAAKRHEQARELRAEGLSLRAIATRLGISKGSVEYALRTAPATDAE